MIELKSLTKKFGDFCAVDNINLRIEDGEFFGLLGPNGAGKTTTISMMSTLLLPTSGTVFIDGECLGRNRNDLKKKFSLITQEYSLRQDMNMDEIMTYQGFLYHMNFREIREKSDKLLEFCGLTEFRKRDMRKLSGGMKRKLMVCRALLTDPQIPPTLMKVEDRAATAEITWSSANYDNMIVAAAIIVLGGVLNYLIKRRSKY